MRKTFFKNLLRDIKNTLSRFLSIIIIIAVGVAFYSGVRSTSPDMKRSGDYYFRKNNLMDFKLISTLGLTEEDLEEIGKIEGVTKAQGAYSLDAVIKIDKRMLVLNINSLPQVNGINDLRLVSGRRVEKKTEAVVEDQFLKEHKLKLGDKITLSSGNDTNLEERMEITEFEVVGTAQSPLYVSGQRALSSVGSGTVRGFVYILPEVFKQEVYTEIYVKTDSEDSNNSLLDNDTYKKTSEIIEKKLKSLGEVRREIRYAEVLKEGEEQIRENKDKLRSLKKPEWYVLGRSTNVGYETYRQDSERINNIGKAFPFIFFLVAALVSLTTMTRMVQEKRTEIGVFKALGYSRTAIVAHYLIYSLAASLMGSLIGMSIGFRIFPPLIMNAYGSLYTIPETIVTFNTKIAIQASLLAILFTTAAAAVSTMGELREVPAALMRPKPPKSGKSIILEKVPFIWKRLSFTNKVTARNIFRYKQRFFMTVIGIAACTGLMITGFGIKSGIRDAMERQFNKINLYDMVVSLTKTIDIDEKNAAKSKLLEDSNISAILFSYIKNSSVKKPGSGIEDAYLVVPEKSDELNHYINLNRRGKALIVEEDGVIITEKLSKLINKKVGEDIEVTIKDREFKVKITAITEHYVHHYIYMSAAYYEKLTGEEPQFNSFYGLLKEISEEAVDSTNKKITALGGIGSVSLKHNTRFDLNKSIASINTVVLVLIASAGVLAFVVIYNLTNININERNRELATIKLLGFFNRELALYIYRENILLTIIGSLAGILLGKILNNFVINSAETNVMLFVRELEPIYFVYSTALTIIFSIMVNLAMYWRFDKIDMIESLKSAE